MSGGATDRSRPPRAFAQAGDDTALLIAAIGLEQVAVATYGSLLDGGSLAPATAGILRRLEGQEREHVEVLASALDALGVTARAPGPPSGAAALRAARADAGLLRPLAPARRQDVTAIGVELENAMIAGYHAAVGRLRDARLVTVMTQIMAAEAQHATVLRALLTDDPAVLVPDAFELGEGGLP